MEEGLMASTEPRKKKTPVALVKTGRGNLGGSTFLSSIGEIAIYRGTPPILADGDARNPGISVSKALYDKYGVPRPASEEAAKLREWFADTFGRAAATGQSLVIDVGGGDRTLENWAKDENIIKLAEGLGISVTGAFMIGPQQGDTAYLERLWASAAFRPSRAVLVFNEWTVPTGHDPDRIFDEVGNRVAQQDFDGCQTAILRVPKLSCLPLVLESGLTFHDAAAGKPRPDGTPLDPFRRAMIQHWIDTIKARISEAGIEDWLP